MVFLAGRKQQAGAILPPVHRALYGPSRLAAHEVGAGPHHTPVNSPPCRRLPLGITTGIRVTKNNFEASFYVMCINQFIVFIKYDQLWKFESIFTRE